MRIGFRATLGLAAVLAVAAGSARAALTSPWDDLVANPDANWIVPNSVNIYAANTSESFPVSFGPARTTDGGSRGMNSLKFVNVQEGHHATTATTGSVDVLATGGVEFDAVIILVAIDATSLPANFGLTMNGYECVPREDFVYYDGTAYDSGRPTGYYPGATNPESEPIAYDFAKGMVTVLAFTDVTLKKGTNYTLDYAFENLPGRTVFSVYGFPAGDTGYEVIYHTNRGLDDISAPLGSIVSTFETAALPGDANGDGVVDAADYVIVKRHFGDGTAAGVPKGDFDNDGDVALDDLRILAGGFGVGSASITPEPATAMLLVLGGAAILRRRRQETWNHKR